MNKCTMNLIHMSFCVHIYSNAVYDEKAAFKKIDGCITDLFHYFHYRTISDGLNFLCQKLVFK